MRLSGPFTIGVGLRFCVLYAIVAAAPAACGGTASSGDTALVVEVLQDEITLENHTGTALSRGEISIMPQGFPRPYVSNISYLSSGAKRSFSLNSFRMSDGSPFRRDVANGKSVKVTARDATGKTYEREVPFK
jgi:hypothetical protein